MSGTDYKIFTTEFDVETTGDALTSELSWAGRTGLDVRTRLYKRAIKSFEPEVRKLVAAAEHGKQHQAVSILIDHSGSLRGQRAQVTCFTAEILSRLLIEKEIDHEILGFTTSAWQGGRPRKAWIAQGRPKAPGRLNELLHIVYKPFDEDAETPPASIYNILREDLLKENVDGEALHWAATRLNSHSTGSKHLIVISDGAPVDDSTLAENDTNFLFRHIKSVIAELESQDNFSLHGIGIEYKVSGFYTSSIQIDSFAAAARLAAPFLEGVLA